MVKWSPNKGRVIEQAIDETSTTQKLPLGTEVTAWDSSSDAQGEGRFIYALGLASTVVGSLVNMDEAFVTTLGVANGKYKKIGVSMSINIATQYGWYQTDGKAIVKALTGFADEADCYLTATAGSIDDAVVSGDLVYGMKGASAVGTPSSGLAYVQMNGGCFSLDGDDLEDQTFTGTVSIGESGSAGVFYIFPATASKGKLIIAVTDQTGDTAVTLQIGAHGQATSVHLPDAGLSASYLLQSTAQITVAEADVLDGATAGTNVASKVVVADANVNIAIVKATELHIGATGSEVQLNATPLELNQKCDRSTGIVDVTGSTVSITSATHAERLVTLNRAAGIAVTLPVATGTGDTFKFLIGTTISSNSTTIKVADATDSFVGMALGVDTDAEGATGYTWNADASDDTITMDGTATGGVAGDYIEIFDYATNLFLVKVCHLTQSGASEATPFSATVA